MDANANRTSRLLQSASEGIEFLVAGLRVELVQSGGVPIEVEAVFGRIVGAACELRGVADREDSGDEQREGAG